MTTTIAPSLGNGVLFTQGGVGAAPGYSALDRRRADSLGVQAGVLNATDFMVVQRGAGANMSIDIGMPAGGGACVLGSSIVSQGLYYVPVHSATINEAIAAAHATLPRVDSVYLQVQDTLHDASGQNRAQVTVVTGTPTGGATLANRTGAAAAPTSSILLADVLVAATVTTIPNTVIRDRRMWARGAYARILRTQNAAAGNDYSTASTSLTPIDATNLAPRIECSGAPVRVSFRAYVTPGTNVATSEVVPRLDGVAVDGVVIGASPFLNRDGSSFGVGVNWVWDFVPAAGSHVIDLAYATNAGTMVVRARAGSPMEMVVEEIVRQNVPNNSVTSG